MPYIIPLFEIDTYREIGEQNHRSATEVATQIVPFVTSLAYLVYCKAEVQSRLDGLCVGESIYAHACTITRTR